MAETEIVTEAQVLAAISATTSREFGEDLVARGFVRNVKICEGNVAFELVLPPPARSMQGRVESVCAEGVSKLPGVSAVNVRTPVAAAPAAGPQTPSLIPGVRSVIAVGSGKGGVGKSTVAVNLAVALAQGGARVGLLDADVYGPSIPLMMGIRETPLAEGGKMVPLDHHGVKLMSLGFLMPDDASHVIWRGPMVASAIKQMLADCKWGELDYLLVDLPPGTGDAQLTLAQSVPITGAVVVMTSQDVAVSIASKAIGMFRKLNVPILGVVGNMDSFACPCCGTETPIFTRGGSEAAAAQMGVPFLGSIPLDPQTVEHGDSGTPTVLAAPESTQAGAFRAVAHRVVEQVDQLMAGPSAGKDPLGGLGSRFKK